ncbi:hypothetical protein GNT69_08355 [Bacillus sp. B15-48]|nr:hypothetical protein [Bacillus sp. B15-48]
MDYAQRSGIITPERAPGADEETAAEIAVPIENGRASQVEYDTPEMEGAGGGVWAFSGLAVSILSLFVLPIILGITGVVLGFVARNRRGANGVANWAIGIGALSIIIGMFVLPFY